MMCVADKNNSKKPIQAYEQGEKLHPGVADEASADLRYNRLSTLKYVTFSLIHVESMETFLQ